MGWGKGVEVSSMNRFDFFSGNLHERRKYGHDNSILHSVQELDKRKERRKEILRFRGEMESILKDSLMMMMEGWH